MFANLKIKQQKKLTPNAKTLYVNRIKMQNKLNRLSSKMNTWKSGVRLASKFAEENNFNKLAEKVNSITYNFICSQTKNQKVKPKGRRFTLDDKILALSVYKQSPKGYRYLSTIFSLPSLKTIMNLLKHVPFTPGINNHIIEHIKCQAQHLLNLDKKCMVLFDEMALEAKFTYDKYTDCIFGFEDFGSNRWHLKIADHVLIFMVHGIKKKFKQPICYYFVQGTTQTRFLVQCIKEVLGQLSTTGLSVIGTVSDQGSTNVAAIN